MIILALLAFCYGCQGWTRTNTERLNRPPCYFDTTWQQVIGAAGKTRTCIDSFRRRMPRLFRPRQHGKWSEQQDFHLRPPGPRPGALKTELRSDKMACQAEAQQGTDTRAPVQRAKAGGSEGTRTLSLPADNGLLWLIELRIRKWPAKPKLDRAKAGGVGG